MLECGCSREAIERTRRSMMIRAVLYEIAGDRCMEEVVDFMDKL